MIFVNYMDSTGGSWVNRAAPCKEHNMIVKNIIDDKGHAVAKIRPDDMLVEAAQTMRKYNAGSLVVTSERDILVGLVSERDIVHAVAQQVRPPTEIQVKEVMAKDVPTCTMDDAIIDVMHTMTEKRVRHMPVMKGERLTGIISIGDVVKLRLKETKFESQVM